MKIGLGLPTDDMMDVDCVMSLLKLQAGVDNKFTVINQRSCYIDASRNAIVKDAQRLGMDYLLFVDSDMAFPSDGLLRLINANVDIIGVNYAKRRPPHGSMATGFDGQLVDPRQKGVSQVMMVGTGFMLIKMSVFDSMEYPWFETKWGTVSSDKPDITQYGEDVRFCAKAFKAGFKVFCHHDLSMEIVHIGQFPYKLEMFIGDSANG